MEDYRDFSHDPINYKGLAEFVVELHAKNMHYIPIIDAGIAMKHTDGYNVTQQNCWCLVHLESSSSRERAMKYGEG